MSLFSKLFGTNGDKVNRKLDKKKIAEDEFFEEEYIKALIKKYKRTATLLRPQKSETPLEQAKSKFGGIPNFENFESYPTCTSCDSPLNFVLQFYKKDFPTFYFPDDKNLFQLFRCPNNDCPDQNTQHSDRKMSHYYSNAVKENNKILDKPTYILKDAEKEVPDCNLTPKIIEDFPNFDDFEDSDFANIEEDFGNDMSEAFMDKYAAVNGPKFNGYPSYTQSPVYPQCLCGKTKEFFFQLSSDDREEGINYQPPSDIWSAHGIMIGDLGNIYYYVCKSCGEKSIESNWDCY